MSKSIQLFFQMADRTAEQITGSYQKWTAFLTTAARLYKYPYNEQLMIIAENARKAIQRDLEDAFKRDDEARADSNDYKPLGHACDRAQ